MNHAGSNVNKQGAPPPRFESLSRDGSKSRGVGLEANDNAVETGLHTNPPQRLLPSLNRSRLRCKSAPRPSGSDHEKRRTRSSRARPACDMSTGLAYAAGDLKRVVMALSTWACIGAIDLVARSKESSVSLAPSAIMIPKLSRAALV